ncbi:amidohydrolase [Brachybacterium sp. EF45031]|uniref:amidohydrolase family protein n=1 Tax=Brachybacterium sillae TaxID=2810536 RepID=UPI00217E85EC|nr:amidohydrolase family protein [Brachybacterium sillae]MCS6712499.1 amidohydrolase [Brachybacterium sillae]
MTRDLPTPGAGAIDTHAHVYPAEYLDRLEAMGVDPETTRIARDIDADITEDDLRERLEWMDRAGVAAQVLSVVPQSPAGTDPEASLRAAQWINDCYAGLVTAHPGRFLAYGALPLPHIDQSLAELERVLTLPGMVGIALPAVLAGGVTLDDPRLDPVWQALDAAATVVYVQATGGGLQSPLLSDHGHTWVNGAPVEDATAVLHLLRADVPARFPAIRFHVAHLGGDLPFLARRLEDNYEDWGSFAQSPLEALTRMWLDAANFHEPSLRLAVETFGRGRVMAGSDMPYFRREKYVRAHENVRTSSLEAAEIEDILAGTARRLYGLPPVD